MNISDLILIVNNCHCLQLGCRLSGDGCLKSSVEMDFKVSIRISENE